MKLQVSIEDSVRVFNTKDLGVLPTATSKVRVGTIREDRLIRLCECMESEIRKYTTVRQEYLSSNEGNVSEQLVNFYDSRINFSKSRRSKLLALLTRTKDVGLDVYTIGNVGGCITLEDSPISLDSLVNIENVDDLNLRYIRLKDICSSKIVESMLLAEGVVPQEVVDFMLEEGKDLLSTIMYAVFYDEDKRNGLAGKVTFKNDLAVLDIDSCKSGLLSLNDFLIKEFIPADMVTIKKDKYNDLVYNLETARKLVITAIVKAILEHCNYRYLYTVGGNVVLSISQPIDFIHVTITINDFDIPFTLRLNKLK